MHRKLVVAIFAIGLVVVAATGCSSSSKQSTSTTSSTEAASSTSASAGSSTTSGSGGSSGGSASTSPAGGTSRCDVGSLHAALGPPPDGQPGAGHLAAQITFTNTSGHSCTLYGYPGLGLLDGSGHALAVSTDRGGYLASVDPGPHPLTVPASGTATALMSWSDVPPSCLTGGTKLQITPPDSTQQLTVAWGGGPVCDGGRVSITAFKLG